MPSRRLIDPPPAGRSGIAGGKGTRRRQTVALALTAPLRPFVDLCIELGISSPEMERMLRGLFVERAELTLRKSPRIKPTDSGIALMIGVHRSIVRAVRTTKPRTRLKQVEQRHRGDALLYAWATEWEYLTTAGTPKELPIHLNAEGPSFAALARRYMPGIALGTVLSELRRSGSIQLLPDDTVRLRSRKSRHPGLTEASLAEAGARMAELAATLTHNLTSLTEQRLCEGTGTVLVPADRLPLLRQTIARRTQNFLDSLKDEILAEAAMTSPEGVQISIVTFLSETPEAEASPNAKRPRRAKP